MIQKGDWVKIHYTGKLQEGGKVFDTTKETVAKEQGLNPKARYAPFVLCVGEGHIIKGIDQSLIGKNVDETYTLKLGQEEAFGKKNPKLIQLIAKAKFTKNDIDPHPGLQVNVDGQDGIIKSSASGRVLVDFNHPLSGRDVSYEISIEGTVENDEEKIAGYLTLLFQQEIPFTYEQATVQLKMPLPQEMVTLIQKELSRMLEKEITILNPQKEAKDAQKKDLNKDAGKGN